MCLSTILSKWIAVMDDKELIARRVALELKPGNLANLGIGLPQTVANYLPPGVEVFCQSENGIIGMEALPEIGMEDPYLTDAGGRPIGAIPGACSLDTCLSFGLIWGGHLDVSVLGGLQVDVRGQLANWTIPGKMIPGMGGAMDLVTGTKRVIVAMTHTRPRHGLRKTDHWRNGLCGCGIPHSRLINSGMFDADADPRWPVAARG